MANQLIGTILSIGATQDLVSKSGNSFKRRELILMLRRFDPNTGEPITDTENTPQLTFIGDRCADLDSYQPGQVVTISFDIQGRKYTDQSGVSKIINDIRPYKIELYQPRINTGFQTVPSIQPNDGTTSQFGITNTTSPNEHSQPQIYPSQHEEQYRPIF